jgi:hypothetical protein
MEIPDLSIELETSNGTLGKIQVEDCPWQDPETGTDGEES